MEPTKSMHQSQTHISICCKKKLFAFSTFCVFAFLVVLLGFSLRSKVDLRSDLVRNCLGIRSGLDPLEILVKTQVKNTKNAKTQKVETAKSTFFFFFKSVFNLGGVI